MGLRAQLYIPGLSEEQRRRRTPLTEAQLQAPLRDMISREQRSTPAMKQKKTVYLLENREYQRISLTRSLAGESFEVAAFSNVKELLALVCQRPPGLLILGCALPGANGTEIVQEVRKNHSFPVILISSTYGENECVYALESGADDYMTMPFSPRELVARVKALFRRMELEREHRSEKMLLQELTRIRCNHFLLDMESMQLSLHGLKSDLTSSEFLLIRTLMREPGKVFSREELQGMITDERRASSPRAVDEHIRKLREKIETIGGSSRELQSIRGAGYKFG